MGVDGTSFQEFEDKLNGYLLESADVCIVNAMSMDEIDSRLNTSYTYDGRLVRGLQIHDAVEKNDVRSIVALVEQHGMDVNSRDKKGDCAIHTAVKQGKVKAVAALIKIGAQVNNRDAKGMTPLHNAARGGFESGYGTNEFVCAKYCKIIQILLEAGADINALCSRYNNTALHKSCMHAQPMLSLLLLRYGAESDISNAQGDTPLLKAVRWDCNDVVVAMLLCGGANLYTVNSVNNTPFYSAFIPNHTSMVTTIMSYGQNIDFTYPDCHGNTCLHYAVNHALVGLGNDIRVLKAIDRVNNAGFTALHHIATAGIEYGMKNEGGCRAIKRLFEYGASMHTPNNAGLTVRDSATLLNLTDVLEVLDERQVQIDEEKMLAVMMGLHPRLGETSWILPLNEEVLRMVHKTLSAEKEHVEESDDDSVV